MSPWNDRLLVYVDDEYDAENASDRVSRYGAYLRQRRDEFRDPWYDEPTPIEDPAQFAIAAWRIATPPVMVPGYARIRPDLRAVTLQTDEDGELYAEVHVPLLHRHIGGGSKRFPYAWQDWQAEPDYSGEKFLTLHEPRGMKNPSILATAVVRVPGRDWPLITPAAYEGPILLNEARETVFTVAQHINDDAGPIVARLLAD